MAKSDYYLCDVCEGKAFYDADIQDSAYIATYDHSEDATPIAIKALCSECAKTHEIVVQPKAV